MQRKEEKTQNAGSGRILGLLAVAMLLCIYMPGCLDDGGDSSPNTITVWHTYPEGKEREAFLASVEEFKAANPDVTVKVEWKTYPGIDVFKTSFQGNSDPDVMRIANEHIGTLVEEGMLEPLTPFISDQANRFLPFVYEAMKNNNEIYALPASYDCRALIYNKAFFPTNPPDENMTLEQLEALAQSKTSGTDKFGLTFSATDPALVIPFIYGFGGYVFKDWQNGDLSLGLNSQGAVNALIRVKSMLGKGFLSPSVDNAGALDLFNKGKAAMLIDGPWNLPTIENAQIDFGVVPLPKVENTSKYIQPLLSVKGYAMSKHAKNRDLAFKFIDFMTSKNATLKAAKLARTLPSVAECYQDPDIASDPVMMAYRKQADVTAGRCVLTPTVAKMDKVWTPLTNALTGYIAAQTSDPKSYLDQAVSTIESS